MLSLLLLVLLMTVTPWKTGRDPLDEAGCSPERGIFDSYEVCTNHELLSIDQKIQYRAEQALGAALERSHAKSGSVIVMDPDTGEILAMANVPSFNPNRSQELQCRCLQTGFVDAH